MKKPKPDEPKTSCKTCQHYRDETESGDEVEWGECWRYPPAMMVLDMEAMTPVPVTAAVILPYCCGEHRQRLQ